MARGLFQTALHMLGLAREFFRIVAARFAAQDYLIRHDVDRHASFDNADISSGFMIDAAKAHLRDSPCGYLNRIDASFRTDAGMRLEEAAIPVRGEVAAACELLGLDPLYVANEGKLVAICPEADAERLLAAMRTHPLGREAARIGSVVADPHAFVQMRTGFGGSRMVDWLAGEQLPRIC